MSNKFIIPKTLAECADLGYQLQQQRYALQRQCEELKSRETALKQHIIDNQSKSKSTIVGGTAGKATINEKDVPQIKDRDKFLAYVRRTNNWDLAQNLRLSVPAVKSRWDDGKKVPGVEPFKIVSVTFTKV